MNNTYEVIAIKYINIFVIVCHQPCLIWEGNEVLKFNNNYNYYCPCAWKQYLVSVGTIPWYNTHYKVPVTFKFCGNACHVLQMSRHTVKHKGNTVYEGLSRFNGK